MRGAVACGNGGGGAVGEVDGGELLGGKPLRQPCTILVRAEMQNEDIGHANSPRQRH